MTQLDDLANAAIPLVGIRLGFQKDPAKEAKKPGERPTVFPTQLTSTDWPALEAHVAKGGNIGLRTGAVEGLSTALIVVDLDSKNPGYAWSLSEDFTTLRLGKETFTIPADAWIQQTASGGYQVFFQVTSDAPVALMGSTAGALAAGVDTRQHNGYVVAPPSDYVDDKRQCPYHWLQGRGPGDRPEPAELPMEMAEFILSFQGKKKSSSVPKPTGACPKPETVRQLLTVERKDGEAGPKVKMAEWNKRLLKTLKVARDRKGASDAVKLAHAACAGELKPAPEGKRDDALTSIIGTLAYYLASEPEATAEHLLACLDPYLSQIKPPWDQCPYENAWDKIGKFLEAEEVRAEEAAKEQAEAEQARKTSSEELLERFQQAHPTLGVKTTEEMLNYLFMIDGRGGYFILRPSGYYEGSPTIYSQLTDSVKSLWKDREFPVSLIGYTPEGMPYDLPASEVVNGRCCKVDPARFTRRLLVKGLSLEEGEGGRLLVYPRGWFRSLPSKRWPTIAQFLDVILTKEQQQELALWLLTVTRFPTKPVTMLVLVGARSCGKSLLSLGIGGLFIHASGNEGGATDKSLQRFNGSVGTNATLRIEEATERGTAFQTKKMNFTICDLLTGKVDIEPKGKEVVNLEDPCKIIFTCNHEDIFKGTVAAEAGTEAEAQALAVRCTVMILKNRGKDGVAFFKGANPEGLVDFGLTKKPGEEWVGMSGPQILRQHLLWMADEAAKDPELMKKAQSRFGVEGNAIDLIEEAQFDSDDLQNVIQVISQYGDDLKKFPTRFPLRTYNKELIGDGEIWITAREVKSLLKAAELKVPEPRKLKQVLKRIAVPGFDEPERRRLDRTKEVFIYRLDLELFSRIALEAGNSIPWADAALAVRDAEMAANQPEEPTTPPPAAPSKANGKAKPPRPSAGSVFESIQKDRARRASGGGKAQSN